MIGFFPDPYPDELLYSVCARYSARVRYPSRTYVVQELFGANATAVIDLPCRLADFVSVLPQGHRYTVKRLIDEHTLLPFYSPFLPPERVNRIRESMSGFNDSQVHACSGILASLISSLDWLRFCPLCTQENIQKFGEIYWHRLHQLPGVEVCPIHHVFLESSAAKARNRTKNYEFVSANEAIKAMLPRSLDLTNPCHQAMLGVATDATWLFSQQGLVVGYESLSNRYFRLLVQHKLAHNSGSIRLKELARAFLNYYPPELLSRLQCEVPSSNPNPWLARLVPDLGRGKASHPLHHLLLIQFLGTTAEEFFTSSNEFELIRKPFGTGSWPCLDPTSNHFQQLTIDKYYIGRRNKHDQPIGTFRCACGFSYSRTGPDLLTSNQFQFKRIISYSQSWENALRHLWLDSSLNQQEIGRKLGVSGNTVRYHAIKLGLPRHRLECAKQSQKTNTEMRSDSQRSPKTFQEKLESYRTEWLSIREKNPEATRVLLQKQFRRVQSWLYKNDPEWLEAHQPPSRLGGSVDWNHRDQELADAVRTAAQQLKHSTGHPEMVTVKAIGMALERRAGLFPKRELEQMPLTAIALAEVVETWDEFTIRRLRWAQLCFRSEGRCPKRYQLLRRASINLYRVSSSPQVQEAIEATLQSLASMDAAGGAQNPPKERD